MDPIPDDDEWISSMAGKADLEVVRWLEDGMDHPVVDLESDYDPHSRKSSEVTELPLTVSARPNQTSPPKTLPRRNTAPHPLGLEFRTRPDKATKERRSSCPGRMGRAPNGSEVIGHRRDTCVYTASIPTHVVAGKRPAAEEGPRSIAEEAGNGSHAECHVFTS
eukprot:TRINITY_DN816_c0_g1_i12.p2 TRINITY_DN816_c0_g1~~TRINITY_DN816_c0_g1_i12.p2  ORF type:complete len:164 (+),score=20.91 TRINITY_DN816_c0_g1_i12:240-731(+)